MEKETETKRDLQQWLSNLLDVARVRFSELDKSRWYPDVDLRDNCQIEIFWLAYPENQIIVFTLDNERDDKEIHIYGPSWFTPLFETIEEVMQTERWNRLIPADVALPAPKGTDSITYSKAFQSLLTKYFQIITTRPFDLRGDHWASLSTRDTCVLYRGNIAEGNFAEIATIFFSIFTRDPFSVSKTLRELEEIKSSWPKGYGSFFYPLFGSVRIRKKISC
jgi:hypothetical protein